MTQPGAQKQNVFQHKFEGIRTHGKESSSERMMMRERMQ